MNAPAGRASRGGIEAPDVGDASSKLSGLSPAELAARHRRTIEGLSRRVASRCHQVADPDDLYQCGMLGLLEAAHRYEPSTSMSFWSYARHRVIGAMFDEVRSAARRSGGSARRVMAGPFIDDAAAVDALLDHTNEPGRLTLEQQLNDAIGDAMDSLPGQERQVVHLYYRRGLKQRLIAKLMHLTESRIHQIRSEAVARIVARVAARTRVP